MSSTNEDYYFLKGGGEMGELIRAKDWSKTSLGDPANWPQSLCTMVAVMLDNPFGMYIAWGSEYIQLYNEGYRPILGATKHPQALGISTRETFSEIWHIIEPMFDDVMKGKAVGFPDFMLPLNRYGYEEECYFDFSYSPIRKNDGEVGGVLVTVIETTNKKKAEERLNERKRLYETITQNTPDLIYVFDLNYRFTYANEALLKMWGRSWDDAIGKGMLEVGYEPWHAQMHEREIDEVIATKKSVRGEVSFPHASLGKRIYDYILVPVIDHNGKVEAIAGTTRDITHQVEAYKQVEESEQRLNLVLQASELGTWELNLKTKEPTYSKRYLEILGGYKEDIKLSHAEILQHLHPDDFLIREKAFKEAITTGYLHYEARLIWNDKSIHWMEGRGKFFYDEENKPLKLIGTIRDITEEKNHEEELKKSEEQFKVLADQAPMWVWLTDKEVNILYTNPEVLKFLGIAHYTEFTGNMWEQKVHQEDIVMVYKTFGEAASLQQSFSFEFRVQNAKTLQYEWFYIKAVPRLENGEFTGFIGTGTNINEQKTSAKELEEQVITRTAELKASEEKFYNLFNLSPICKTLSDVGTGKIVMVNDAFTKLFGYSREETLDKSSAELGLLDLEARASMINELYENGKIVNKELGFIKKSGERFVALASAEVITMGDKQFFLSAFNDISEIKKAEQNIKQKNIELEKMNKELQSFAYISSHDLQEPLRKIQTFATRITEKEEKNLSDAGKDMFKRMQDAAKRMQTLIQDLLAYSRTNTTEHKFKTTDLNEIIAEVKEDLKEELKEKHATIEANQLCNADIIRFQFRQLMYNLISNSLKFSNPNHPPLIQIRSEIVTGTKLNNEKLLPQNKYCHITVSDNGIGFEEQYKEKIFEVFQRLHSKNEYDGTGIGLSIVKKIVENHHGIITATGELNKGATFDIYIPAT